MKSYYIIALHYMLLLNTACFAENQGRYAQQQDSLPKQPKNVDHIKNAVPKIEPRSRYGNASSYKVRGKTYHVLATAKGYKAQGLASWYGMKFQGHRTSNGEIYDIYKMTAAHTRLPLPTYVQVTNLKNKRQVIVKVNDRGPFHGNRLIDLSYAAAKKLGIVKTGTALVEVKSVFPAFSTTAKAPLNEKIFKSKIIQVGAYRNQNNALKNQVKIQELTQFPVKIKTTIKDERAFYRVQIVNLKTVEDFQLVVKILNKNKIDYKIW